MLSRLLRSRADLVPKLHPNLSEAPLVAWSPSGISNPRRWTIVGLLFTATVINYLDRGTLSVALPMIAAELSLSAFQKGLLLWSFFTFYSVMQIPVGWLVDRLDLRWFYAGMFTLWCVSCGLMGLAGSLAMLIALRVLLGVGESIFLAGGNRIVSILFPPMDRGLPTGLFDSGTRIGLAVGTPIIAFLILRFGWRWMFALVGIGSLVWLIPWFIVFPTHDKFKATATQAAAAPAHPGKRHWITFNRDLLGLCLGFFCFGYNWYLLVTWLPDYLMQVRHLSILKAGFSAAVPFLVFAASEALGGWIADRLIHRGWDETRTRKGIVTFAFSMGLLLIPATQAHRPETAILLVAGASLVGLSAANLLVILQRCAPPDEIGAWTGMQNGIGNLGGISSLVMGFLIGRTGSYVPGFVLGPVVLMSGLLAYWFIVGKLRPVQAGSD
jgi:MFS transporter, ACS family, D-galactonate transporter